jgi:hypothetical protein
MNYTQGKWAVEIHNKKPEIWSGNQFIAGVSLDVKSINKFCNFHLMAAAPELLEALQMAIRLIATAENNGAYKDCALPLIGKKSLEKMESLLERLK